MPSNYRRLYKSIGMFDRQGKCLQWRGEMYVYIYMFFLEDLKIIGCVFIQTNICGCCSVLQFGTISKTGSGICNIEIKL
jgi:hypothetical protein